MQSGALWNAKEVDAQLDAMLQQLAMDESWLREVEAEARSAAPPDSAKQLASLHQKQSRIQDDCYEGRLVKEQYLRRRAECEQEIRRLTALEQPSLVDIEQLKSFAALWAGASLESRNQMCRLMFDRVVVDFKQRAITFTPAPEFEKLFESRAVYVRQTRQARDLL